MPHPQVWTSSQAEEELAAPSAVRPSLEWLINPVSKEVFFEEYWEKQPLVIKRNQPNYFGALLSLDEVDRIITTLDLRYPNVTLKNADRKVTGDDYTVRGGSLDVAKVYQLFAEGSTISLAYLDTVIPALTSFCRSLESEFSFPLQANAYLTPARAKGAQHHFDSHDVFVLQVVNSKQWTTYGTPIELPLREQDFSSSVHERGAPTLDFELDAGDIAYIPRGVVHDARSGENVSLHITAGILSYTWTDLLLEFAADASLNDPAFRKALPPGFARQDFDRAQAREIFRTLLQQLSAKPNFEAILDRFIDDFISACPPLLRGQMGQLATLDRLTIGSVAGARTNAITHIRTAGDSTSVDCYGRTITFPPHASEAVRFALKNSQFVVGELPGDLDDKGKLALIRRLVREGLVEVLSA
jgi:ribosomal protein L16 Arg81 hydroxylase